MDQRPHLIPAYTATHGWVGVSGRRPVRVNSWMDGEGELRRVPPESDEFPGWHYGDIVFTPERQDQQPHDHDYYEICLVRKGVAAHRTDFSEDELHPGTLVVVAPGMVHAIYGLRELHQTNIYYLAEWLSDDLSAFWGQEALVPLFLAAALFRTPVTRSIPQFSLTEEEVAWIDPELSDIGRECYTEAPSHTFLKSSLLKLLIKLSRAYKRHYPNEVVQGFRDEVTAALGRIEQAILQCEPFSVSELAEQAGVSTNHFAAIFKDATGWSPTDYYQRRRVQHASRLLLDPQRSITDVAHELGYFDSAHLCHFFRRYQNMPASRYRRIYSGHKR